MNGSLKSQIKRPGLRLLLALPVFVFSATTFAEDSDSYSLCKLDREVRTLRVEKSENAGKCQTIYNKYGKDQNVGEAQNQSSCVGILTRIQGTLEEAGWKCRSVKSSSSSSLGTSVE